MALMKKVGTDTPLTVDLGNNIHILLVGDSTTE
jgi:hypothetical protein